MLKGKHFLFNWISNLFSLSLPLFPFTAHLNSPLGKLFEWKIKGRTYKNGDVVFFCYFILIVVQKIYLFNLFIWYNVIPRSAFIAFAWASGMLRTSSFPRASCEICLLSSWLVCFRVWIMCTSNWSLLILLPTASRALVRSSHVLGVTWSEGFCATGT